jgi:hypothetical protein
MPYWHVKCLHKERTHCLIQDTVKQIPFAREEHDIREIKHIIVTSGARQIPKCRRWRSYPVLAGPRRAEQINRWAVLIMGWQGSIKTAHIRH